MNKQYRRERNRNFLVLSYEEEKQYLFNMFLENQFDNVISCVAEMVNGTTLLYYDISSLQCMSNTYSLKEISEEQINQLMASLMNVVKTLGMCLLDGEGLLLSPENIYQDINTGKWYFIYFPGKRIQQERSIELQELADFLVMRTEHTSQTAVEISYQLYQKIQEGEDIQSCIQFLSLRNSQIEESLIIHSMDSKSEINSEGSNSVEQSVLQVAGINSNPKMEENTTKQRVHSGYRIIIKRSVLLIGIILAISIGITRCFELIFIEKIFLFGIGVVISIAFSIFSMIYNQKKAENKKKPWEEEIEELKYSHESYIQTSDMVVESMDEKTVFMGEESINRNHKLYGMGKQKGIKIELNDFPFLIGKKSDMVDFVLKDETISKIHARFRKEKDDIFISDTNSLNGVFKNGVRLDPNEEVLLEEEDEIQLGAMTFIYR